MAKLPMIYLSSYMVIDALKKAPNHPKVEGGDD